ncbi:response regulator [Paenibacillus segetis]|uniref:histidine kinase n=1 Tax=Paenibacillus segetis TaxID=1325360 RepID=A0ABQ1YPB5_9BACL|nr:response regulator [Paenibacillus segetis]GGH31551.1 hypothetical protein GCM10008013_35340 [Paenibacillus segetis]
MLTEAILLVGDDRELLSIEDLLSKEGFQSIVKAGTAEQALCYVGQQVFDIIVIDTLLPDRDGIELCKEIRMFSQTPIILIMTGPTDCVKLMDFSIGADDYIAKPYNPMEVVARIYMQLRRDRNNRAMLSEAIVLHSDYKFVYVNPAGLDLFGVSSLNELIGRPIFDWIHPDYTGIAAARMKSLYEQYMISPRVEYKVLRADGSMIDVEVIANTITYNGVNAAISLFRELREPTQLKKNHSIFTEQTIQESEDMYSRLQRSLDQFSRDLVGVMKMSQLEQRFVKEVQDILQVTLVSLIETTDNDDKICEVIENDKGCSLKIGEVKGKSYLLCIDEEIDFLKTPALKVWLETTSRYVNTLFDNFLLIGDITTELERAIPRQVAPTWLLRLLFNLSENERRRLSQDLHDAALQEQIILYRKLDLLLTDQDIPQDLHQQLGQIAEGLLDVIDQIRIACNELRPPMLLKAGLISSLKTLFDFTQLRSDYSIRFNAMQFKHTLHENMTIGLYRIVQELLANATKHSSATEVHIQLSSQGERIRLDYEDNGIGMGQNWKEESLTGMGIYGMRERVRSMDGIIEFFSSVNNGLAIYISIPAKSDTE